MYKPVPTSGSQDYDSLENKITVAEILSSMTNGEAPITPVSFSAGITPNFPTTSSILTPTTLANLEQTFGDFTNQQPQQVVIPQGPESGFVPPVVNPIVIDPHNHRSATATPNLQLVQPVNTMGIKREYEWDEDMSSCSSTDPEWNPSAPKRSRVEGSLVPPIDPSTYLVANSRRPTGPRRERKHDSMTVEEAQKRNLRRDRNKQAAAKCRQRRVDQTNVLISETESLEEEKSQLENEIQNLQSQKEQLQFLLDAHSPLCKNNTHDTGVVKTMNKVVSYPVSYSVPTITNQPPAYSSMQSSRPNSLPLRTTQALNCTTVTSATGVPISTPSAGVFQLGLDTMLDGHTGLTPLTGAPSCGSQVQLHRNSNNSDSNSPSDSTLISL